MLYVNLHVDVDADTLTSTQGGIFSSSSSTKKKKKNKAVKNSNCEIDRLVSQGTSSLLLLLLFIPLEEIDFFFFSPELSSGIIIAVAHKQWSFHEGKEKKLSHHFKSSNQREKKKQKKCIFRRQFGKSCFFSCLFFRKSLRFNDLFFPPPSPSSSPLPSPSSSPLVKTTLIIITPFPPPQSAPNHHYNSFRLDYGRTCSRGRDDPSRMRTQPALPACI